jgi:hypothetical protein
MKRWRFHLWDHRLNDLCKLRELNVLKFSRDQP